MRNWKWKLALQPQFFYAALHQRCLFFWSQYHANPSISSTWFSRRRLCNALLFIVEELIAAGKKCLPDIREWDNCCRKCELDWAPGNLYTAGQQTIFFIRGHHGNYTFVHSIYRHCDDDRPRIGYLEDGPARLNF